MYALTPRAVYLLDSVREDPDALQRTRRILDAVGVAEQDVRSFSREQACDVALEIQSLDLDLRNGPGCPQHERALVFTRIVIDGRDADETLISGRPEGVSESTLRHVLGHFTLVRDTHNPADDEVRNLVCWNTQDFGVMFGCPHGCQYCGAGKSSTYIAFGMNIGEYMQRVVRPTIEKHPAQKCFRLLGWSADIATFEPEYGAFAAFLTTLSDYDERYGYFHTAGDNVDWIETVPHRDRLIGVWSMTCEEVSRLIEPGAPSAAARIEAARTCQQWGLPVRFKFKPTIPVRGWRESYAETIKLMFERTRPESLGFCVIMWMNWAQLVEKIDPDLLDPAFVAAARAAEDELRDVRTGPFPHRVRAEVYRFLLREVRRWDQTVPLYISTESREMWRELSEELGQNPRTFICGCNPIEAPGPTMLPSPPICASTYC